MLQCLSSSDDGDDVSAENDVHDVTTTNAAESVSDDEDDEDGVDDGVLAERDRESTDASSSGDPTTRHRAMNTVNANVGCESSRTESVRSSHALMFLLKRRTRRTSPGGNAARASVVSTDGDGSCRCDRAAVNRPQNVMPARRMPINSSMQRQRAPRSERPDEAGPNVADSSGEK